MDWLLPLLLAASAAFLLLRAVVRKAVVLEYEKGLLYRRGAFRRVLGPGQYWFLRPITRIVKVDARRRFVTVPNQDILTSDNVSLKLSVAAEFDVVDPARAVNTVQDYEQALYLRLQLALRGIVGGLPADELLEKREAIAGQLLERCQEGAETLGLQLHQASLKDTMFPGDLKKIFAEVVKARKEGLAALEKARGERAALRLLANAAQLMEDNPSLTYLRTLQALGDGGNSVVLGGPLDLVSSLRGSSNGKGSGSGSG